MGYFNYFIKCLIRNITFHICKPKNFLVLLVAGFIVFGFGSSCFASEWTEADINFVSNQLTSIDNYLLNIDGLLTNIRTDINDNQINIYNELVATRNDMKSKFDVLQAGVRELNLSIKDVSAKLVTIKDLATTISSKLDTLQAGLKEINTSIGYCVTNLQMIRTKIDTTNLYLSTIDQNVQDIRDAILNTNQQLEEQNQKLETQNQLQQEQNNFLQDSNVSADSSDLPSFEPDDVTIDGFNNIFNSFYNTFTGRGSTDLVLPLPFVNKEITINYNTVFGGFAGGIVFTLANAFWYYAISVYIVKDVYQKMYAIKTGNIENIENTNIKEDLL